MLSNRRRDFIKRHYVALLSQSIFFQDTVDLSLMNVTSLVAFIISFSITLIAIRVKANLILPVVYCFAALLQLSIIFIPENTHMAINAEQFSDYVAYIADRRLERIGLPLQYNVENPFPWMSQSTDLSKEKNFFETRVTEYQTGGALEW